MSNPRILEAENILNADLHICVSMKPSRLCSAVLPSGEKPHWGHLSGSPGHLRPTSLEKKAIKIEPETEIQFKISSDTIRRKKSGSHRPDVAQSG